MRFHLTYSGPLKSNKPWNPDDPNDRDKRAGHKHSIRRCFHTQLKRFWEENLFYSGEMMDAAAKDVLPRGVAAWVDDPGARIPMVKVLGEIYGIGLYKFVPLAWKEAGVGCSLRMLCLRREDTVAIGRDLDNRIKTVIDALTRPLDTQGSPLAEDGSILPPQSGEDPFYVLMDDDRRVDHLEVKTDALLDIPEGEDESWVHLVINVELRATVPTVFNSCF